MGRKIKHIVKTGPLISAKVLKGFYCILQGDKTTPHSQGPETDSKFQFQYSTYVFIFNRKGNINNMQFSKIRSHTLSLFHLF